LPILAFFHVRSTLAPSEAPFGCSPVLIAQHVGTFRLGAALAWALVRPYFSYLLYTQSDFGHAGPLCVHVLFQVGAPRIGLPPKAGLSRESERSLSRVHKTF